jgi:hypothetical protein
MPYEIIPNQWVIAQSADDKGPLIIRANLGLESIRRHADFAHQLGVAIPVKRPNHAGLPDGPELAELKAIEDVLIPELERDQESISAVVLTGGAVREYILYTRAPEAALDRVRAVRAGVTTHELQYIVHHDPQWMFYEAFAPAVVG